MSAALSAAGGLALFLLAMAMMTGGLKAFGGGGLKRLLERWTSTPARGVLAGALVTCLVQLSGAVVVLTIGLINAGVLTLRQGLGVVYGSNVGTTMTAWLVSLVGFGFDIDSFALPLLAGGVALRLAAPGKRAQGLGEALAGFGLFFLGLGMMRDAFAGFAAAYGGTVAAAQALGLPGALLAGLVLTVLTQSSSAALALVLTAAAGGVVGVEAAAAAVIGANLGTTSTAAFAALKATAAAKRLALAHIVFNAVAAAVALALLPGLLWIVAAAADGVHAGGRPAVLLALFHTVFNLLGVAIMLPLTGRLAAALERLFRAGEDDIAQPRHLDATLRATPELAVAALREELLRLRALGSALAAAAMGEGPDADLARRAEAVRALAAACAAYAAGVGTESMSSEVAEELARALRTARYLEEAARLAPDARLLPGHPAAAEALGPARECIALAARAVDAPGHDAERSAALERFEHAYQRAKAALVESAVARRVTVDAADALLDALSGLRRLIGQLVKADRLLRTPSRARHIEAAHEAARA
ncbi:MAG TPA: Na/Pi symporter [Burkholderiales bacterium]|nr:Na/Pi symporter [Burkholderiales bacterium]